MRASSESPSIDEVGEHIKQGKLPTQLAMTWAGRVSFVLTEALTLKKVQLLDGVQSGKGRQERKRLRRRVAISTRELRRFMPELISALGGLHEPQAVVTAAPAEVKEAATASGSTFAPWDTVPA